MNLGDMREELFLNKRICGLWLIWVAIVIVASAAMGGQQLMLPAIFYPGYVLGVVLILNNKFLYRILSFGRPTRSQNRMTFISISFMFLLLVLFSGKYYAQQDYRMVWLGAFLAIALHFIPFSRVHGKAMIYLSIPLFANAFIGIYSPHIPFRYFAYMDAFVKLIFGIALFCSKSPLQETGSNTRQ
jgi:hypothetical protein